MRQRKWIIIFSFLFIFTVWFPGVSHAAENFKATLIQPAVYKAKAGDKLTYRFEVDLPDNYWKNYRSMTATILLDAKLKPLNQQIVNKNLTSNDYAISKSEIDGKSLINVSVYDLSKLNGMSRFEMIIDTEVKEGQSNVSKLENSYVMSYRHLNGKESSYQENLLNQHTEPELKLEINEVTDRDHMMIGTTTPDADINVYRNTTLISKGRSDGGGNFKLMFNPQPEGVTLRVEVRKNNQVGQELVKVAKGVFSLDGMEELEDYINEASRTDRTQLREVDALRLDAAIYNAKYQLAKDDLTQEEVHGALKTLKEAYAAARPAFMSGYPDKTFKPTNPMTRAEVSTIFARVIAKGSPVVGYTSFKDIDDDKWYASSIGYIENTGLINGYEDGTFRPDKSITRAEFASIVSKYLKLQGTSGAAHFSDVKPTHWAKESIDLVSANGIMQGRQNNTFAPDDKISRQEVAAAMNKALRRVPNDDFVKKYSHNPFSDVKESTWSYGQIMEATRN